MKIKEVLFFLSFVGGTLQANGNVAEHYKSKLVIAPTVSLLGDVTIPWLGEIVYEASSDKLYVYGLGGWSTIASGQNSPYSSVSVDTANGYGSTNTMIRRFANLTTPTVGTGITYTDSPTDGASFTISVAGVYSITYNDTASAYGVSLNSTHLTTSVVSLSSAERLMMGGLNSAGQSVQVSFAIPLQANDVIRPHTSGTTTGTMPVQFSITQINP